MKIVLASTSPRRFRLLKGLGLNISVVRSRVKESKFDVSNPEKLAKTLAIAKAQEAAQKVGKGIVIGADTIVVLRGKILGKPKNEREAKAMLRKLSGRTHEVMTGLAVIDASTGRKTIDCVRTKVKFRKLTEEEISSYVATGEPLDKAGAYGIQGRAGVFVEKIDGCYYNVVGLPLARLAEILKDYGVMLVGG
jgi:septum formation protein